MAAPTPLFSGHKASTSSIDAPLLAAAEEHAFELCSLAKGGVSTRHKQQTERWLRPALGDGLPAHRVMAVLSSYDEPHDHDHVHDIRGCAITTATLATTTRALALAASSVILKVLGLVLRLRHVILCP